MRSHPNSVFGRMLVQQRAQMLVAFLSSTLSTKHKWSRLELNFTHVHSKSAKSRGHLEAARGELGPVADGELGPVADGVSVAGRVRVSEGLCCCWTLWRTRALAGLPISRNEVTKRLKYGGSM